MRFTVLWTPTAERDLAELWLNGPDREAIRSAADTLESLLRNDAHSCGESRYGPLRIAHAAPLGIDFEIDQDGQTVWVLRVWRFRKH
jgi:mRNA-degrading endonuclease RelE of RelBE toxin-antitoxin system